MSHTSKQEQDSVKTAQALKKAEEEIASPVAWEKEKLLARCRRMQFMALLAAGFSENQALYLVKQ